MSRKALSWVVLLGFAAAFDARGVTCHWYANTSTTTNSGTGDGLSAVNAKFWPVGTAATGIRASAVLPGQTVCIVGSGIVSGGVSTAAALANVAIRTGELVPAWSGTDAAVVPGTSGPITVTALNYVAYTDTDVLLRAASTNNAVSFQDGSHDVIIEGFFIEGNFNNDNQDTVSEGANSTRNTLRQSFVWGHNTRWNSQIVGIDNPTATHYLIEDVGIAGFTKKVLQFYGSTPGARGDHIARRVWGHWDFSADTDPKEVLNIDYRSWSNTSETSIQEWHENDSVYGVGTYAAANDPAGAENYNVYHNGVVENPAFLCADGPLNVPPCRQCATGVGCINLDIQNVSGWSAALSNHSYSSSADADKAQIGLGSGWYGNLLYMTPGGTARNVTSIFQLLNCTRCTAKDIVTVWPTGTAKKSTWLRNCTAASPGCYATGLEENVAAGITNVGGQNILWESEWSPTATRDVSSCAGLNCYQPLAGAGADLCTEWQDRTKTAVKMWPWRMNEMIKRGGVLMGHGSVIDVDANVQSLLGAYIPACTNAPDPPTPTPSPTPTVTTTPPAPTATFTLTPGGATNTPTITPGGPTATRTPTSSGLGADEAHFLVDVEAFEWDFIAQEGTFSKAHFRYITFTPSVTITGTRTSTPTPSPSKTPTPTATPIPTP
jgi:hypothetical protein